MNKDDKINDESLIDVLDDDKLREWFKSRDPERKKVDPFITEDAAAEYGGQASSLTAAEEKDDKIYGISYSQHERHVKDVSKHFAYIGCAIGLIIAIIITIII